MANGFGMEQFYSDLKIANKTEKEVAELISNRTGAKVVSFNDDYKYDVLFEKDGKTFTVEIKEDFSCARTNNIGLEYSCRGKDSGIQISEADYYCYKAHRKDGYKVIIIKTSTLKEMIEKKVYHRTVNGGDPGSNSLNYLFYLSDIEQTGKVVYSTQV